MGRRQMTGLNDEGLMSDDFKDGKGILFIGMDGAGDKAKFTVTEEAKEFLSTVRRHDQIVLNLNATVTG